MTQVVRRPAGRWMLAPDRAVDVFDRLFGPWLSYPGYGTGEGWMPACDVVLRDGDLVVRVDLPGVDPDRDVRVSVEDGVLYIRGERRWPGDRDSGGYHRREWAYGRFQRAVPLPDSVVVDDLRASYADGVLEIVVPRYRVVSEPRRIPVRTGSEPESG
jgi:HSP20 family protein